MGLTPDPEGKQTNHPINRWGKKIFTVWFLPKDTLIFIVTNLKFDTFQQGKVSNAFDTAFIQ